MAELKQCRCCGEYFKSLNGIMCSACKKYFREGGKRVAPPPKGEVEKDYRGYYICHICGMAYPKLLEHVRRKHHMTADEYREEFGLTKAQQLTSDEYHEKMSQHMKEQLRTDKRMSYLFDNPELRGKQTRLGKKQSLQEINNRRESQRKKAITRWGKDESGSGDE